MSKEKIFKVIQTMIAKQFDVNKNKITPKLNFKKDLDADSIDFVEFVMALQDKFNATISDKDANKLKTVGEAVNYIASHNK